jgi:hypothetical protein
MKFTKLVITLFSVLACLVLLVNLNAQTNSTNYAFDVSILPEQDSAGVFQAKLSVIDLHSNKVISAPTIRFRAGQPAHASSVDENGMAFQFSVSVDELASVAEYKAEALKGSTTISRSQAKIALNSRQTR